MFNPSLANTLPNGATIIDRREIGNTWVWLCDNGGYMPYVTWISSCDGDTVWGHYYEHYDNAYEDFCIRIQDQWAACGETCLS